MLHENLNASEQKMWRPPAPADDNPRNLPAAGVLHGQTLH
jgi:hypothetical protein